MRRTGLTMWGLSGKQSEFASSETSEVFGDFGSLWRVPHLRKVRLKRRFAARHRRNQHHPQHVGP